MLATIIAILATLLLLNWTIDTAAAQVSLAVFGKSDFRPTLRKRADKRIANDNFLTLKGVWSFVVGVLLNQGTADLILFIISHAHFIN